MGTMKNQSLIATSRNDNLHFLQGKQGSPDIIRVGDKYELIIGTGGCRSRAIPCTELSLLSLK